MKLVRFEGEMTRHYIPELIGGQYFLFSSLLLNDSTGAVVEAIERSCQQDSFWINREVLRRWLQGKGRKPVTWATLIGVLREDWNILAEDIEGKVDMAIFTLGNIASRTTSLYVSQSIWANRCLQDHTLSWWPDHTPSW